ncbi:MAG: PIN domain-containing protein [Acidobacteria bacterium]|nr:PIN domain-containing protein [Acidobacteriota bacterium]
MIAVDTNILVYAHRRDAEFHEVAESAVRRLAEGSGTWAIPWPCLHEFHAIVTHPRVYDPPTKPERAIAQIDAWLGSPSLALLSETAGYWEALRRLALSARVIGPRVHDARIAALCALHGVRELWTADRDFSRFPSLDVRNPLAATDG